MSDLYLLPTPDGGELVISGGQPQTTSGLETAVYLSLFTPAWWGNAVAETEERYDSPMDEILARQLTNSTRLAAIDAARTALQWMLDTGVAQAVDVDAEIPSFGTLYMAVRITEPSGDVEGFRYAINWRSQEASLL